MKRRTFLFAALLAVTLLTVLGWLILRNHEPPEPVYKGKRLSEWWFSDGSDGAILSLGAREAVRGIGTNAIPTLLRLLNAHDSSFKLKLMDLVQKQTIINLKFMPSMVRNNLAMQAFAILGSTASNAVPALLQMYEENSSEWSQCTAINSLGSIGPPAIAAVPMLLRAAADTNAHASVRIQAAGALGKIHAHPELVVPVLIRGVADSDLGVRLFSAHALGLLGSDARAAVPALVELLKDPVGSVREKAEEALKAIDPEAATKVGIK